jgi:hypothetical protein
MVPNDILRPEGTRPDYVTTYAEVAGKSDRAKQILGNRSISLHPTSVLATLMSMTYQLSSEWNSQERSEGWEGRLFSALHVNRICDAVIAVEHDSGSQECLKRIAGSDMNLPLHDQSQGKDSLFELELLNYLRQHRLSARLEEPDIVVDMPWGSYPIACKKINSIRNLEKQVSSACRQLKPFAGAGLIALNIDVLVPENHLLGASTGALAGAKLQHMIDNFRERHGRKLREVMAAARCDGVLLSLTSMADVEQIRPRLNYFTQTDCWTLSNRNYHGRRRMREFSIMLINAAQRRRNQAAQVAPSFAPDHLNTVGTPSTSAAASNLSSTVSEL